MQAYFLKELTLTFISEEKGFNSNIFPAVANRKRYVMKCLFYVVKHDYFKIKNEYWSPLHYG